MALHFDKQCQKIGILQNSVNTWRPSVAVGTLPPVCRDASLGSCVRLAGSLAIVQPAQEAQPLGRVGADRGPPKTVFGFTAPDEPTYLVWKPEQTHCSKHSKDNPNHHPLVNWISAHNEVVNYSVHKNYPYLPRIHEAGLSRP